MGYEINFLVLQSQTEKVEQIREQVQALLKEYKGSVTDELVYKKRKLAYEIRHEIYGFFTVLRFDLEEKSNIFEIKRELNLLQDIARYIIVKTDELPEINKDIVSERKETTVRQEDVEKIVAKKEVIKKEVVVEKKIEKEEIKEEKKEEVKEEKKEEKKEEVKEEKKEEVKEEKKEVEKEKDEDKTSLEDLDKKLDEILST